MNRTSTLHAVVSSEVGQGGARFQVQQEVPRQREGQGFKSK